MSMDRQLRNSPLIETDKQDAAHQEVTVTLFITESSFCLVEGRLLCFSEELVTLKDT